MILIIFFLILYLLLAIYRLDWAVMFLLATLPSYLVRFSVLGIPFTFLEGMILISFVVWLYRDYKIIIFNIRNRFNSSHKPLTSDLVRYPFDVEIILFLIISFISVGLASFSNEALGVWKAYFFEPLLLYILVFNVFFKSTSFSTTISQDTINKRESSISLLADELTQDNKKRDPVLPADRHDATLKDDRVGKIIWPLVVSSFVISVFAIYQKFTGVFIENQFWATEETRRVTSFFEYPNAVGLYLAPLIMLFIGFLFSYNLFLVNKKIEKNSNEISSPPAGGSRITSRVFLILTVFLSLISVYFAKSEGALVGLLGAFFVFGIFINKKIRVVTILISVIIIGGVFCSKTTRDFAFEKIALKDLSGEIRKQQWRETWEMLTDNPFKFIFGTGLSSYQKEITPYHQEGIFFNAEKDSDFRRKIVIFDDKYRTEHWQPVEIYMYPHNILLNFWTELGFAGMLLFVWIIGKVYVLIFKNLKFEIINYKNKINNRFLILGLGCSVLVLIIHGIVDVPYFKNDLAVIFWIIISIVGLIDIENKIKNGA